MKIFSATKIGNVISLVTSSNLVRSSGVYTISSFINSALPLILLPILTRKLSPADYGLVAMFQLVVSLVYPFIGMNLEGSISRKYFDKDATDFPSFIGSNFKSIGTYSTFIVLGYVFQDMYYMVTNYIFYSQKTHILAFVTISNGLIKLPIAYFSIVWFGSVGASISFCVSWFFFFVTTCILSARVYKMPWLKAFY